MIHALHARNYRSLGTGVSVVFPDDEPRLLVLAGINGSGKSNVLDAFRFVTDALRDGLEGAVAARGGFESLRRTGSGSTVRVAVEGRIRGWHLAWVLSLVADAEHQYRIEYERAVAIPDPSPDERPPLAPLDDATLARLDAWAKEHARVEVLDAVPAVGRVNDESWAPIRSLTFPLTAMALRDEAPWADFLREVRMMGVYALFPPVLRVPFSADARRPVWSDGRNWVDVLDAWKDPMDRNEFRAGLARIVPDLVDFRVTHTGGFLVPEFEHRGSDGTSVWRGARDESDGTVRCAALLATLLQHPLPSVVGVEEPELAVHVGVLPLLLDYIEQAANQTAVILSTHSPDLLDLVPADRIRVVERDDDGTHVRALEATQRRLLQKHLASPGALLRDEGLQGQVGRG